MRYRSFLPLIKPGQILVDIGCGDPPELLNHIAPKINFGFGLDKFIRNKKIGNIQLIKSDIEKKLPLKDNLADCVTMLAVLEHLKKPEEIVAEINRILKKNGRFFLTVPAPAAKPILEFMAFYLKIIDQEQIADHKKYWNKKALSDLLKKSGFRIIKLDYFELGLNIRIIAQKIKFLKKEPEDVEIN
jgi:ubiquinone/menaquinone biosynthesis C-methylase UbiE